MSANPVASANASAIGSHLRREARQSQSMPA
jgi:hypothetical protein